MRFAFRAAIGLLFLSATLSFANSGEGMLSARASERSDELAPLTKRQILSWSQIQKSINAAIDMAHKLGRAGSYVLVDRHGEIIAAYRMPGALPSTSGFAKSKAVTAVAFGVPSESLATAVPKSILANIISTQGGKYVVFPGGYPVRIGHKLIGGIAFGSTIVSIDSNVPDADTPHKDADMLCAQAALKALTEEL